MPSVLRKAPYHSFSILYSIIYISTTTGRYLGYTVLWLTLMVTGASFTICEDEPEDEIETHLTAVEDEAPIQSTDSGFSLTPHLPRKFQR